ncbi:MAG: excinuclease ABC subunit UvrC [Deltaproteobacteria bacterium]|nr:excinuclease ABC subunit UvrC [Deltaproteobacteria bacterium]
MAEGGRQRTREAEKERVTRITYPASRISHHATRNPQPGTRNAKPATRNPTVKYHYELDSDRVPGTLPEGPGVYQFKEKSGRVIYIGKAKSLKKRIRSYLNPPKNLPYKTALMMKRARGLDVILTATEKEAFILESSLVKKFMPRYNIILRDDKQFPCLRLSVDEPYPRLSIARRFKKDGARYFGPFSSAQAVRSTLKVVERVFQIRKCKGRGLPKRNRPCLNFQMGLCMGACSRDVPQKEYQRMVRQVILFLEGRSRELTAQLQKEMAEASHRLDFEKAARIRDQIKAVEKTVERQHVVSPRMEDMDVIGILRKKERHQLVILFVRKGCLVGSRDYLFRDANSSSAEVCEAFLKQFYARETFIPRQIPISERIEEGTAIGDWLSDTAGRRVTIHRPVRGEKRRLVDLALANAENRLEAEQGPLEQELMGRMQQVFGLDRRPRVIEGLDISNLRGGQAVGTVVSFVDGTPHRGGYRNYKIKEVEGIDDYGMMAELVLRRTAKGQLPDLFLVDGGKGHLSAVWGALRRDRVSAEQGGAHGSEEELPAVVAIAKPDPRLNETHEKCYVRGRKNPVSLGPDHPVLLLLMRIRDEAHRRAITHHRKLRSREMTESRLDLIPGVGASRKGELLRHFKDMRSITKAGVDDLTAVSGISVPLARRIFEHFRKD